MRSCAALVSSPSGDGASSRSLRWPRFASSSLAVIRANTGSASLKSPCASSSPRTVNLVPASSGSSRYPPLSGIGPDSLRAAAREPNFLLGVLDHVAGDEALLIAFAGHSGIDPSEVASARDVLAGRTPEVP